MSLAILEIFQQALVNTLGTHGTTNKLNENENGRIYGQLEFGQQKSS
jgi:hypothetical protein